MVKFLRVIRTGFLFLLIPMVSCGEAEQYEKRAVQTLDAIKENNWHPLYACKDDEFKKVVPYETFLESMKSETSKISLRSYEIVRSRIREGRYIGIEFEFTVEDTTTKETLFTMRDEQIWEIGEAGQMICHDLGMSMFLPFNGGI